MGIFHHDLSYANQDENCVLPTFIRRRKADEDDLNLPFTNNDNLYSGEYISKIYCKMFNRSFIPKLRLYKCLIRPNCKVIHQY